jgi:antitoxin PrlF
MEYSSISSKGQITIPAHMRKALGLKAGGKVAFRLEGDTVRLVPVLNDVSAAFGLLRSRKAIASEDLDEAPARAAVARYRKTLPRAR